MSTVSNDWQTAYAAYQQNRTPETLTAVVRTLDPTIDQAVVAQGGDFDLLKPKARLLAAQAIEKYDPAHGAALPTWVSRQMQPLGRFRRLSNQVIKIPEGLQLDAFKLHQARAELTESLGREPELQELADTAGLSLRRIREVNRSQIRTPGATAAADGSPETLMAPDMPDRYYEALDALYQSSDATGRAILEGRFGADGKPEVPTQELIRRTKLSPFQLSRKTTALRLKLDELQRDLDRLYGS